jgi:hypothetical protein
MLNAPGCPEVDSTHADVDIARGKIMRIRTFAALPALALLVACGGGGETGAMPPDAMPPDATPPPFPQIGFDVPPVRADGSPIAAGDYLGRSFPLLALSQLPGGRPEATTGEITIRDDRTILVRLPGLPDVTLNRIGAVGNAFQDGGGAIWLVGPTRSGREGQYQIWRTGTLVEGSFGFETPVAARPATATYRGSSVVGLDLDNGRVTAGLQGLDNVDLTATFTGAGGTITGTLIDTDGQRDITGDGVREGLFLRVDLDGVIVPEGFTGTLAGAASAQFAGETLRRDLDLQLSDEVVAGRFYGNAAEGVAGIFNADATLTIPGQGPVSGTLSGQFRADAP